MPVTIVATPGDAAANSYATEVEFIAYLATRLHVHAGATVTGTTCTEQEKIALIEATRDLTLLEGKWEGQKMTLTQALSWPRQFAINPDAPEIIGIRDIALLYYGTTVVPDRMKNATCELALAMLVAGTSDLVAVDPRLQVHRKRIDVIETEYVHPQLRPQALARFPRVLAYISPLFNASGEGGLMLVRS